MVKKIKTTAVFALLCLCLGNLAQAQFGGLQMQIGGYGNGFRAGGIGYGNGFYNNYGNGYGYGYPNSYVNYSQLNGFGYNNGYNSSYGYRNYPAVTYSYGTPRYYAAPLRFYARRWYR